MRTTLSEAVSLLLSSHVVAVPTETVYGLAACLNHPTAIEKIFALKKRPKSNPLIIHIANSNDLNRYVIEFPPGFEALAEKFWPGPLTCILPVNTLIPSEARAGLKTAGFRIPEHPLARRLLEETGPLVMPSANLSGKPSGTRPEHVEEDFGANFPVLDGGVCAKGLESTILFFQNTQWVVVRLGALPPEAFCSVLGYVPDVVLKGQNQNPLCPGQLFRHYAPRARLILGDRTRLEGISDVIGFKERIYPKDKRVFLLGSLLQPEEVAENLYAILRQIDDEEIEEVWVDMDFPRIGLWKTIAERLERAGE